MNLPFFIARRLYFNKDGKKPVSHLAVRIATVGVSIGLAVMIVSVCIVLGFKNEIREKVIGFGSHIEVLNSNAKDSPESFPISTNSIVVNSFKRIEGVKSVQRVSTKFGIIKTDSDYKGILFKGIGNDYDESFLREHLVKGYIPVFYKNKKEKEIVISRTIADEMHLHVGDKVFAYFFEDDMKMRRYHICGIYSTDMQQFDDNIVITSLSGVNKLNNWSDSLSSSLEISVKDFSQLDNTYLHVVDLTKDLIDNSGNTYEAFTVKQLYSQIFDWLQLLDLNIWVILSLMIILACLTMISGLLILILEKTSTIGILKSMGAESRTIRNIFIYYACFIIGRGLVLGYIIGLGLSYIQYQWHIVSLNPEKYYVGHVPILFNWPLLLVLGISTLVICILVLIGPSFIISRIRPSRAIKFE